MGKPIQLLSERERILLESAQPKTYRVVEGGSDLRIHFYFPKDWEEAEGRPVMLFFHGGAWDRGTLVQFAPHALCYVERGAICGLVEFHHQASHPGSSPIDALQDGRLAIQFVRDRAKVLHVDPDKVIAVGAGAGGNIVGCAALKASLPKLESEFGKIDYRPNAAILLSSIVDIEKGRYGSDAFGSSSEAKKACLSRYVSSQAPPMLMIHGTADRLIPFFLAEEFAERMEKKKGPFRFVGFEGRDQNFFHHNTDPVSYEAVLATVDEFLDEHGLLQKADGDEDSLVISWREYDY